MTQTRRKAIDTFATSLRQTFNYENPATVEKLKNVVSQLNGTVEGKLFNDITISGSIKRNADSSFSIIYNSREPGEREVFTIAHEMGHLFLHLGYIVDDKKWESAGEYKDDPMYRQGYTNEEYEANQFAAGYLMPKEEYLKVFAENKGDVLAIARHFGVSYNAAETRGQWLGKIRWN